MIIVIGFALAVSVIAWTHFRQNYSRHVCHAYNFRMKIYNIYEDSGWDDYWKEVYEALPSAKAMARRMIIGGILYDFITTETQQKYFEYDVEMTRTKGIKTIDYLIRLQHRKDTPRTGWHNNSC